MDYLLVVAGAVLLAVGGDILVRGAAQVGRRAGLSNTVVGLTVVSVATAAPELVVTLDAVASGAPQMAVGNIVGSNTANVMLVLGGAALVGSLVAARNAVRFDLPAMVVLSLVLWLLALDGDITRLDGGLLVACALAQLTFSVLKEKRTGDGEEEEEAEEDHETPAAARRPSWLRGLALVGVGVGALVLGADWMVAGAAQIAADLGVSDLVIGLTVVAIGTALPELATSVLAAMRGSGGLAIGNAVGSNIVNLGFVLAIPALVGGGLPIAAAATTVDIPIMIAAAVGLWGLLRVGGSIERWQGAVLLGLYTAYVAWMVLYATDGAAPAQARECQQLSSTCPAVSSPPQS